jgi:hypothetical protein
MNGVEAPQIPIKCNSLLTTRHKILKIRSCAIGYWQSVNKQDKMGGGEATAMFPLLLTYITQYNYPASPPHTHTHTRQFAHLNFFRHIDPKTHIDKGSHNILQHSCRLIIIMPLVSSVNTHTPELTYVYIRRHKVLAVSDVQWRLPDPTDCHNQPNTRKETVFLQRLYVTANLLKDVRSNRNKTHNIFEQMMTTYNGELSSDTDISSHHP